MNQVYFYSKLPSVSQVFKTINPSVKYACVVCDKKIKNHSALKKWKKHPSLKFYFVQGGESCKSVKYLSTHLKKIMSLMSPYATQFAFIGVGGGSIGDLTGFLASIYKRGLPLVHVPTTYLSALDSAHGGKTGLNLQKIKNFIGTYYFPNSTFIVKDFFKTLSENQKQCAYGEILKMSIISGQNLFKNLETSKDIPLPLIKKCLNLKMKIVKKDPHEKKSLRKILNLGHTVGHVVESSCSLPHGVAVLHGLLFTLKWSLYKKYISLKEFEKIKSLIPIDSKKVSSRLFKRFLKQDKKYKSPSHIDFIFIRKMGDVFIKPVLEKDLIQEAKRQGVI